MQLPDRLSEVKGDQRVRFWLSEFKLAERQQRDFVKRAQMAIDRYERGGRFNIYWSNTETSKGALLSQMPEADVGRRFQTGQVGYEEAGQVLEHVIRYNRDCPEFQPNVEAGRDDAIVQGRGVVRVTYTMREEGGAIAREAVLPKHVYWRDVLYSPARCWDQVWWIRYEHLMDRQGLEEFLGDPALAAKVPLTVMVGSDGAVSEIEDQAKAAEIPAQFKRARLWEVWNKRDGQVEWLAKGYDDVLLIEAPKVRFEGFFDQPKPLQFYGRSDRFEAIPELDFYAELADELDDVSARLAGVMTSIKVAGFYDKSITQMPLLKDATDGEFFPYDGNYLEIADKGGFKGAFLSLPIGEWAGVLEPLYARQESLKQTIYELTGISDLMRGQTQASETLGAQELKAQFGTMRLQPKQEAVKAWLESIYDMMGEVAAQLFSVETLQAVSGMPIGPEIEQLLRDERMRRYAVNVELESLTRPDKEAMKASFNEFMGVAPAYWQQVTAAVAPIAQTAGPEALAPFLQMFAEPFKQSAALYKFGAEYDKTVDSAMQALVQSVVAAQQQQQAAAEEQAMAAEEQAMREQQGADEERQFQAGQTEQAQIVDLAKAAMAAQAKGQGNVG